MALKILNKQKQQTTAGSSGPVQEPTAFVEIGGYVHQNEGQVETKLYVSDVNQLLKVDDAAITKRMKKLRVSMNVEEDRTPYNNQVYAKKVGMDQEVLDDTSAPQGTTSTNNTFAPVGADMPTSQDPQSTSPFSKGEAFLKNMVDNENATNTLQWVVITCVAVLAAVAFAKVFLF